MNLENLCHTRDSGAFFAYDLDAMKSHLSSLSAEGLRLWYATKANPLSAILENIRDCGFGFDVASLGELEQVLKTGADPKKVLLTGPAKPQRFLARALEAGVHTFVLESPTQLEALQSLAQGCDKRVDILLRLQLEWSEAEKSVLGGNAITPFGMDWAGWRNIDLRDYSNLNFLGFHTFQWGNLSDPERLFSVWKAIGAHLQSFADEWNLKEIPVVDLGGGLGIPYDREGHCIDWSAIANCISELRKEFAIGELWLELGRYAVGPYGKYCVPVLERKTVRGRELLVVEGGMNHVIRPSLVQEPFPTTVLRSSTSKLQTFYVHGPLCTALDGYGALSLPADVRAGDWLIMHQAGAYGFTESMPFFLCHDLAAEHIWQDGDWRTLRPTESPDTWLR